MVDGLNKYIDSGAQARKALLSDMRALKDKVIVQKQAAKEKAEAEMAEANKKAEEAEETKRITEEQANIIEKLHRQFAEVKAEKAKSIGEDAKDDEN